jgi:4-hydroxymandelate oxidase
VTTPVNIFELEAIARERLPREAYDYYASGAQDEVTLRENRAAYDRLTLAYRVLVDVSRREMATTVLGQPVAMPLLVAPTTFHRRWTAYWSNHANSFAMVQSRP